MIEKRTANWEGAVIILRPKAGGDAIVRPAAFVFDRPRGFAWLEPSYADPNFGLTGCLRWGARPRPKIGNERYRPTRATRPSML